MNRYMHFKLMMYLIMLTSTMMAISSTNMFMTWMCLELNLFSFIPIMVNDTKKNNTEMLINYFLPQTLGSNIFLMSSTMIMISSHLQKLNLLLLLMSTILKLGIMPCHHWFPLAMEKTNWLNCFILATWQKIAPLFILLFILSPSIKKSLFTIILSTNAIMGSIMGLSQLSMKKVMAYSSITHMSWSLSGLMANMKCLSITYFLLYTLIVAPLFFMLNKMNYTTIYNTWDKQKTHKMNNIITMLLLLSVAGLPPLTGFIPKLLMMNILMNYSMTVMIILIISSMMNLFFYLNISLNLITKNQETTIKMNPSPMYYSSMMILATGSFAPMMLFL